MKVLKGMSVSEQQQHWEEEEEEGAGLCLKPWWCWWEVGGQGSGVRGSSGAHPSAGWLAEGCMKQSTCRKPPTATIVHSAQS